MSAEELQEFLHDLAYEIIDKLPFMMNSQEREIVELLVYRGLLKGASRALQSTPGKNAGA